MTSSKGKRQLVFDSKKGYVDLPFTVACGQCIGCRLERSRQWSVRLVNEAQLHELKCFVTLTYDDEHLPEGQTLVKQHFQHFMMRLRKHHATNNPGAKIRYFHCGEYGETTNRPHYHAILFGVDFTDKKPHSKNAQGDQLYISELLTKIWGFGNTLIGSVTPETCAYTARYLLKKVTGKNSADHYRYVLPSTGEIIQRQPEYITMSLKPGIGSEWYAKFKSDVFPSDTVVQKGKAQLPPRYYTRKLETEDPETHKKIQLQRSKRAVQYRGDNTPQRLADKELCRKSKIRQLQRKL